MVVTVCVTVLTDVDTVVLVLVLVLVLVDGGSVVVVVVGASVVVAGGCVVVGDSVTVWVTPGAGASVADVAAVVDIVGDVVVVVVGLEPPLLVNWTIA